eukprot:c17325_g1_i1 orf=205-1506(+)
MMNAKDDHWPSLPPIRTSSYNSRVCCETLNLHTSLGATPTYPHTTSNTPSSASHPAKRASVSADASPFGTPTSSSSSSHLFSSCFPHKNIKRHGHEGRRGGVQGGTSDASRLLRSIFGFSVPRYSSPVMSYGGASSTTTNSPSGRRVGSGANSPINLMRSGGTTPHSGVLSRSSKGHAALSFTMMPPDVVGKKKPLGYESDEPTSPEVTCIGKVRRKHCKATWDALVKEKQKDAKKKGKAKRSSEETPRKSDFALGIEKSKGSELNTGVTLSKQRSRRQRSCDFEGFPTYLDAFIIKPGDSPKGGHIQGMHDVYNGKALVESMNQDASTRALDAEDRDSASSFKSCSESIDTPKLSSPEGDSVVHEELGASFCDESTRANAPISVCEVAPPSNCLLLMKKGSRNRSAHYPFDGQLAQEQGHSSNHWNWGQVLT